MQAELPPLPQGASPSDGQKFEIAESVMDALKVTMRDEHCCYAKARPFQRV